MMRELLTTRPLFCACSAAVATAVLCSFVSASVMLALFCAAVFSFFLILPVKSDIKITLFATIAACALMASSFYVYYSFVYDRACTSAVGSGPAELSAISEVQTTSSGNKYIDARCVSFNGEKKNFKVRLYFSGDTEPVPSSVFSADIIFADKREADPFDSKGVHVTAFTGELAVLKHHVPSLVYYSYTVREFIRSRVVYNDKGAQNLVRAMILGDKKAIDPLFKNKLAEIGMSHITAVSGLHLLFTVLFFDWILILFGAHRKTRSVFAIIGILLFTVVSGFSVSCIRAGIMLIIYFVAVIFNRFADSLTSLSVAAFLILLAAPYNVRSASFILSAGATFGLIALSRYFRIRLKKRHNRRFGKLISAACRTVSMSVAATIACIPAFIYLFEKVNYLSPLSNVLLLFPAELMMYIGLAGILLSFFPFAVPVAGALNSFIYKYFSFTVDRIYHLPFTSVSTEYRYFYIVIALLAVLTVAVVYFRSKRPDVKIYPYIVGYAAICAVLFLVNFAYMNGVVTVKMIDVGQGGCTVFTNKTGAVVVDCGGTDSEKLYNYLRRSDIKRIEVLAFTHADYDHVKYINYFLNLCDVDRIVFPSFTDMSRYENELARAMSHGTEVVSSSEDMCFDVLDGARLTVFQNRAQLSKRVSNTSAAYKLEYNGTSVLCPGDMNVHEEYAFLGYGDVLDCDILVAPHHGSDTSSSTPFLRLVSPDYTVISVGKNDYGLPGRKALYRISQVSPILRTDELSTITFRIGKGYKLVK